MCWRWVRAHGGYFPLEWSSYMSTRGVLSHICEIPFISCSWMRWDPGPLIGTAIPPRFKSKHPLSEGAQSIRGVRPTQRAPGNTENMKLPVLTLAYIDCTRGQARTHTLGTFLYHSSAYQTLLCLATNFQRYRSSIQIKNRYNVFGLFGRGELESELKGRPRSIEFGSRPEPVQIRFKFASHYMLI